MIRRMFSIAAAVSLVCAAPRASAQTPAPARLIVTVADPSGGVIPNSTVTLTGTDAATKAATIAPVKTTGKGTATFEKLAPGLYSIAAEFPGFKVGLLKDVRLKSGDNKHVVVLELEGVQAVATVAQDKQAAAADPRSLTFGSALTREQIEALSDDPTEMAQQLQDMAGGNAIIRVDSFEGAQLPPKAQIKSIHITRDTFAAENHSAGSFFIDIVTQPGLGPLRVGTNYNLRDGSMTGRNAFVPKKGPERSQNGGFNIGGSLAHDKSSFSLSVNGSNSFTTPNLYAALPTGTDAQALNLRQPSDNLFVSGLVDYAVTRDQTMRFTFNDQHFTSDNQGIGAYDLIERAYSTTQSGGGFTAQEVGPIGRRFFINSRLSVNWSDSASQSATEAPTIIVQDAFTSGGAQQKGGRRQRTFTAASDLDYVRGINSVRMGVLLNGGSYHSDNDSNYLGTYTFTSLAAYEAGTPATYSERIGNPIIDYFNLQAGVYLQDDIRVRKSLTFSPGVRYEVQTHLNDFNNVSPRFGVTWAPFKSGKTTIRGSWGLFYDWLSTGTYEQTLQVDGLRQQDMTIVDPTFPNPGSSGIVAPTSRYLLGNDLAMVRSNRVSAGLSETISQQLSINMTYSYTRLYNIARGADLNAPVNGVRPDPQFANVIEVLSDAASLQHSLVVSGQWQFAAPSVALSKPRFNLKRGSIFATYVWGRNLNDSDGAFSPPPNGTLATEWGPALGDIRNRVNVSVSSQALKNLSANIGFNANTGAPYDETTGLDNNGDAIFNDRPAGVTRNSLRAPGRWALNANFNYSIGFGKTAAPVAIPGLGAAIMAASGGQIVIRDAMPGASAPPRYRLGFFVSISNLTNHVNPSGLSGNLLSPFFGVATAAPDVRRVNLGINFSF